MSAGCPESQAAEIAQTWVNQGDFLLIEHEEKTADFVLGNPPYIRIEDIAPGLLSAYRSACPTMGGRADIYIGFFEKALDLLSPEGKLGFICADRWMRNQYGRKLRQKIVSQGYAVDFSLVMHDTSPFLESVSSYPAVTVIRRGDQRSSVVGAATELFEEASAKQFKDWVLDTEAPTMTDSSVTGARLPVWHTTEESWPEGSPALLSWLELLTETLEPLEDPQTGTRISIGVATGADSVYITTDETAVEPERLLPLAMAADIKSGTFTWGGHYLVNPWDNEGLVDLRDWPRMRSYLSRNGSAVRGRAIARKNEANWHRTIDRVTMKLATQPMLLLQDMKSHIHPVLAAPGFYPHHNLYHVTSREWDLEALGGLLLSEAVEQQVSAYCVKMRGKTMRFQAQYLRRVRVPRLSEIPADVIGELKSAFRSRDRRKANAAALRAFNLTELPV